MYGTDTKYGADFAENYVAYYESSGKNYAAEADDIAKVIRDRRPQAASLLDVACGTGPHLRRFAELFDHVEGVELSEDMVAVGRATAPHLRLHQGDMRDFDLGRRFDAVCCMFSSIGHVGSVAELNATLERFAAHLNPGGVVVIEPWWSPDTFLDGYVTGGVATLDDRTIVRLSHSRRDEGDSCWVTVHMAVADAESGLRHLTEDYLLSLLKREQYEEAFTRAGISVEHIEGGGPLGRGLYVGIGS